jgi:uncharacterized membrane protein YukC
VCVCVILNVKKNNTFVHTHTAFVSSDYDK